ncbi:hypothetical protein ACJJTC_016621 [Scirpophaga incertulas]
MKCLLLIALVIAVSCQQPWQDDNDPDQDWLSYSMLRDVIATKDIKKTDAIASLNYGQIIQLPVSRRTIDEMLNVIRRETHIPGYQFCGPGTNLEERLSKGEEGVNKLDKACLQHDIAYRTKDMYIRHEADKALLAAAEARTTASDSSRMEKLAAYFVLEAMKIKVFGKAFVFNDFMKHLRNSFIM